MSDEQPKKVYLDMAGQLISIWIRPPFGPSRPIASLQESLAVALETAFTRGVEYGADAAIARLHGIEQAAYARIYDTLDGSPYDQHDCCKFCRGASHSFYDIPPHEDGCIWLVIEAAKRATEQNNS